MIQKTVINIVIILLITFLTGASPAQDISRDKMTLTLDDAISLAMERNKDILIANEGLKKGEKQIKEAKSGAFPQISLNTMYTRTFKKPQFIVRVNGEVTKFEMGFNNSIQSAFQINQTLYSGGITWTALKIAKIYSNSLKESFQMIKKRVTLDVKKGFLGVLLSEEVHKINTQSLGLAEAHLKNIQVMYKNGMASEFDLIRAEVQVANTKPRVISSENNLKLQLDFLKNTLGLPLDREIEVVGDLKPGYISEKTLNEASKDVHLERNDYKNLELLRNILNENTKIERSGYFPKLSANYTYQYQGQSDNFGFKNSYRSQTASLNLSIPIFNGFRTGAKVQQARIAVKEMDYQLAQMRDGIEIQVKQALNMLDDAYKRITSTEKTVELAKKAYDISEVRFKSGQGTQLEIFDSHLQLELAQLNKLQSVFDYEIARAQWENAIGN
ncbi:TolC family protein [candidate division KSB1 bacterium]